MRRNGLAQNRQHDASTAQQLIGPKGLSPAVVRKLNEAYNSALALPDIREKIAGPGNVIGGGTPEEFAAFIAAENRRRAALVKVAGIKLE